MKMLVLRSCSDINNTLQVKISEKTHTELCNFFISNVDIKNLIIDDMCKVSVGFKPILISRRATCNILQWTETLIEPDDFVVVDF